MTQETLAEKLQSLPIELRDTFRESMEISLSKRIVNRFMMVVNRAYAEGQRAAWSNGAPQAESTEETYKKGYENGYEHGAEDMREALLTIADMDVVDRRHYFKLDGDSAYCRYDALFLILHANAKLTMETVDLYKDEQMEKKEQEMEKKEQENREKVYYLAQALGGMDVLETLVKELKKEDAY